MKDLQPLRNQAASVVTALEWRGFCAVQRPLFSLCSQEVLARLLGTEHGSGGQACALTLHNDGGTVITLIPQREPGFSFAVAHEFAHVIMLQRGMRPRPVLAEGFAQRAGYVHLQHDDGSMAARLRAVSDLLRPDLYGQGMRLRLAGLERQEKQVVWRKVAADDEARLAE